MDTIKSKSKIVEFERDGQRIKVQRMRWKDARLWIRKLAAEVTDFFSTSGILNEKEDGKEISAILKYLPKIVEQSDDLIMDLLAGSCRSVKPEEIAEMDTMEVSALIAAAIEVNVDDDLKNCWSGVIAGMMNIMGSMRRQTPTTPSGAPMPVLFEQGIQPPTSTNAPSTTSTSSSGT